MTDVLLPLDNVRSLTSVGKPIAPPAVIIGPARLLPVRAYNTAGAPMTAQWNIYYVVTLNEYAGDVLAAVTPSICMALEKHTPGVVMGTVPGTYPSPLGPLPCTIITFQMEI